MTRIKTILAAAALVAVPAIASAGCGWHERQAMSCADGLVYDAEKQACVEQVTG
ncbi:MAG: hypothetical protein ACLFRU_05975 [Paracoccaceae bacterium]